MNEQLKKEIYFYIAALSIILPLFAYINNFLNSESIFVVKAEVESTSASTTASTNPEVTPPPDSSTQDVKDQGGVVDNIKSYVKDKFKDHSNEAFEIIECESNWNTKAINDNTTWGGVGQDRGLWQINNEYHPVPDECAYDYKCATDYAFRMWENDNKSFKRWTCAR